MKTVRFFLLTGFLAIGISAMAGEGLPGEFASNYAMTMDDANASYLNPAQLILVDRPEATLVNTFLFAGTNLMFFNASYPVSQKGTAAFTHIWLYTGGMEAIDANKQPLGKTYSDMKMVFLLSYAQSITEYLAAGSNIKFIKNSTSEFNDAGTALQGAGAYAGALDIGVTARAMKNFYVGLSFLNVAFANFSKDRSIADPWPMNMKLSVDYRALKDQLLLGLDTDIADLLGGQGGSPAVALHYEMEYFVRSWFSLRGAFDDREFGFGLSYQGKNLLKFNEDTEINYVAGYNYHLNMMTNRIGLTTRMGLSRKDRDVQRLGRMRKMAPINAFEEAMRLYHKRQYWDAAYTFGTVVSLYPEFDRLDLAKFYIAESFYQLNMTGAAESLFATVMTEYPACVKLPDCLFRLQSISYQRGAFDKAVEIYRILNEKFPQAETIDDAAYTVGQIYFKRGSMEEAINYYLAVPPASNVYKFAQYSLALCYLHLGNNDKIAEHFSNVVLAPSINTTDEELVNRTNAMLGHFYYELYDYPKAAAYYQKVKSASLYYDDALIGQAWSLVNEKKYQEAIDVLSVLVRNVPASMYVNEATLVRGYCYVLLRSFDKSIAEFNGVVARCREELMRLAINKSDAPRQMSEKEIEISNTRKSYADLELAVVANVLRKPSVKRDTDAGAQLAEMTDKQTRLLDLKYSYLDLKDNIKRAESYEKTLQNAEYAAATAEHLKKEENKKELDKDYEQTIRQMEVELQKKLNSESE